jgi:hypothetical protein
VLKADLGQKAQSTSKSTKKQKVQQKKIQCGYELGYMVRTSDLARPDQSEGQDSNPTTSNPVLHLNEDHHAHACFRTQDLPIKRSDARDLRNRSDDHDMFSWSNGPGANKAYVVLLLPREEHAGAGTANLHQSFKTPRKTESRYTILLRILRRSWF